MKKMKIVVFNEKNQKETIEIEGPAVINEGKYLNRLTTRNRDYYFTLEGLYDGWGEKSGNQKQFLKNLKNIFNELDNDNL